ncbi:acyltransferase [Rossellomorea vietnamensis]|uniref:Acyltransferase n=1 Tax=Rossellomorea vietnamensis TaxID=218284 RepID=A0A5D4MAJ2_9BACI|nr:acyltransferase [Rossellomorea vietnamensis]TYR98959.1 acyltransferase [Rossellomorea vietnamensis]
MQKQIHSIYFLRFLAMLLVVLVHVTGTFYNTLPMDGDAFAKYHFLNRFIRIEAGIFILLTGLVFFYNFSEKKMSIPLFLNYYKKRVLYIIVPYIVWAVFYEFYANITIGRELSFTEVLFRLLQGESYYQLHFIFLIVQFYLVFPLIIILARKSSFFRNYMWLIGMIVQVVYYYINSTYNLVPFKLFLEMTGPYLMGGWIGMHYLSQKKKAFNTGPNIIYGLIFLLFGTTISLLYYHLYTMNTFYLEGVYYKMVGTIYLTAGSYFLFRMAEIAADKASEKTMNFIKNIALYSFGFYLLHPFVLNEVSRFVPVHSNYLFHLEMLLRYTLTVIGCYVIIWTIHKLTPFPGLLFGKLPKKAAPLNAFKMKESESYSYRNNESRSS